MSRVSWALRRLQRLGTVEVSSLYRTEPVGNSEQPWYVNAVASIRTDLPPRALFEELRALERKGGRTERRRSGGPRVLDLDLLLYDDRVLESVDLQVPHPRMHERRFVLEPLVEIAPDVRDPRSGRSALELLESLRDPARVERLPPRPVGAVSGTLLDWVRQSRGGWGLCRRITRSLRRRRP